MTTNILHEPLFELGEIFVSEAARKSIGYLDLLRALLDHSKGNWGYCSSEEIGENDQAVMLGEEVFSRYCPQGVEKNFYIITNEARTKTQVLMSDEY
jgi:hypothetical protein